MAEQNPTFSTLRQELESIGIELGDGDSSGYVTLESDLHLEALTIGFGLENTSYEPDEFPGLIYHLEQPEATVVLFENGVIVTVDGASDQAVKDAITTTIELGKELGLIETDSTPAVETDSEKIPIPGEFNGED